MTPKPTILLASSLALLGISPARAAPVTWDFYETGLSACDHFCKQPTQPLLLATLTLPDQTSTGTADFTPGPIGGPTSPTYTGDDFLFRVYGAWTLPMTLSQATGANCVQPPVGIVCAFLLSWTEVDNTLINVRVSYGGLDDNFSAELTSGRIGTDGNFGGCASGHCDLTGFWSDPVPDVPEPSTWPIFLAGLLGVALTKRVAVR